MRETEKPPRLEASLHGGPAHGEKIILGGRSTWPEFVCVNMVKPGLAHHYVHVAAGVYEHGGACVEFGHKIIVAGERCGDCGCKIVGGQHTVTAL